jgi:acyl dehydratase
LAISNALIGTRLPGATHEWSVDDTILYALSVGARPPAELSLLDEARGPAVLPTFALIANWWAMKDLREALDAGPVAMVHASQSLEMLRPMPASGKVRVDAQIDAVWDKGKNSIVEVVGTGTDADGPLFRSRSATMVLGVGGWGGERGPSATAAEEEARPDAAHDDHVRPDQAALYRLLGDRNRLHIDPAAAREAGFGDVFLHGLCTLGFAARALIATTGDGNPARLREIACRFAKPVMLDGPLRTEVWERGDGAVAFRTMQGDTVALAAGTARFGR